MKLSKWIVAATLGGLTMTTMAQESPQCQTVRFADIGWADIAATNAMASEVLKGLGYKPTSSMASIPITFAGLKSKQIDVYLDYWVPSQTPMMEPFLKAGQIKVLPTPNLVGAKYTLAVPAYVAAGGLKTFADIAKFRDKLDGKIYGIEPGNGGNKRVQDMIDKNKFGLSGFKLVESSEAGMLAEVERAVRQKKWIVFLGWDPHPMNVKFKMDYLGGGDDIFGPNFGEAKAYTTTSSDYEERCPNAGKFVKNLRFSTRIENDVMVSIMNKVPPDEAARAYLKKNPTVYKAWLAGVTTYDGKNGLESVQKYFGH